MKCVLCNSNSLLFLDFFRPILIQFDSYWCFHWGWGSHSCCCWISDFVGAYKKKLEERKQQRRLRYAFSKTSRNIENTHLPLVFPPFPSCQFSNARRVLSQCSTLQMFTICFPLNTKLIEWKQFYIQRKTNKDQSKSSEKMVFFTYRGMQLLQFTKKK